MTTENAATASTETATAVAAQGATVAPERASSKKGASQRKSAPTAKRGAKAGKPAGAPATPSDGAAKPNAKAAKPKGPRKVRPSKPAARQGTHKAEVIAMQPKSMATLPARPTRTGRAVQSSRTEKRNWRLRDCSRLLGCLN